VVIRKNISTKTRTSLFMKRGGICHLCNGKVGVGEAWELEHGIPLAMGGDDDEGNWFVAHVKCHAAKTKDDVANIAKAKRREARHIGSLVSRNPLPGGRRSKFKRKMDGTVVLRERE
jgi:5-methylcytosine-specific restriction endonuclease McrA